MPKGSIPVKKVSRIITLVMSIALITVTLASCTKTPSDTSTFIDLAKKKNYEVQDVLYDFTDTPQVKEGTVVAPSGRAFQIEFYVLSDSDFARSFFNNLSKVIDDEEGSIHSGTSLNGKNYAKRTMSSNGKYTMVEYIENTLVYVPLTDTENKSTVEDFLKEFGY